MIVFKLIVLNDLSAKIIALAACLDVFLANFFILEELAEVAEKASRNNCFDIDVQCPGDREDRIFDTYIIYPRGDRYNKASKRGCPNLIEALALADRLNGVSAGGEQHASTTKKVIAEFGV